ncbi:hypothetical protein [Phage f2b1]|nr:hypothetical protein [Phage f2b1]
MSIPNYKEVEELLLAGGVAPGDISIMVLDYFMGLAAIDAGEQPSEGEWDAINTVDGIREG